ncbi:MAG: ABC transporter substrate-binding protein [Hoeflea sp.]|uniref:ABC transporter substrate-binding protein n=1 Tax=Hoeflea sp. TaxID=1940281 RepID=UPI0032EC60C4
MNIYSATDTSAMQQVLDAFQAKYPEVRLVYTEYNTRELHEALLGGTISDADIVISSSVDLQVDLVNRGMANSIDVKMDPAIPRWAQWRSELFGFTFEPVVTVYNKKAFETFEFPATRSALALAIRDNPEFFENATGTYDIALSGVGYLFAAQDMEKGYQFWRLVESFGRAGAETFCCTSHVLDKVAKGELLVGYNVIGSYAAERMRLDPRLAIAAFTDYTLVMSRSAFVHRSAPNPDTAELFIEYLLSREGQRKITQSSALISILEAVEGKSERMTIFGNLEAMRPIKFSPGLIGYLDRLKRAQLLADWQDALGSNGME